LLTSLGAGCVPDFEPKSPPNLNERTFGEKFFTIACQRVAYTSSLRGAELNPNLPVDVAGQRYRQACRYGPEFLPPDAAARDPKVATLMSYKKPMVEAVNLIFPGSELSDLQDYMISILPLTDDDSFPAVVRKGSELIGMMEQDQDLHWALARLDSRVGYRPRDVCLGMVREMLRYDKLHPLLTTLLELTGEGGKGHQAFLDLMEAVSLELRTVQRIHDPDRPNPEHPGGKDRTLRLALDLMLSQDPAFGSSSSTPMLVVRRDWRGLARVSPTPGTSTLPLPFVDSDNDGLADMDVTMGSFLTSPKDARVPRPFLWDTTKPDTAPKRDGMGRALDAAGNELYDYIDLDTTLIAALSRDAVKIMDPVKRTGTKLLIGLSALLGPRIDRNKAGEASETLSYKGFDTKKAPLLDFAHAALSLGRDPGIDDTLNAAVMLLKQHETETARLLGAAFDVKDLSKLAKYGSAKLDPKSNFFDDLIAVVRQIAVKDNGKLLEDLIAALADPRTKNLGGMFANYYRYRDVHQLDQSTLKVKNPYFNTPVDRSKPDSGHDRSIQQRLQHIIANTNGMKMCSKEGAVIKLPVIGITIAGPFKACELFQVDNGALLYTESIARLRAGNGNLTTTPKGYLRLKTENMPGWVATIVNTVGEDEVLKLLSGIDGLTSHPTTEALNRLMFMDPLPEGLQDVQDPAVDVDGHQVCKYHVGSLLSWEVPHPQFSCSHNDPCQFYDAIRPVVQAFADHDAEQLFLDLLTVLHRHWASRQSKTYQFTDPQKPDYATGSAVVTYEPLLVDVMEQTDLMHALNAVSPVLNTMKLDNGQLARRALSQTVAFLVDPTLSAGLTYRDGRTESKTTDGTKTIPGGVSPFYLLADAWAAKTAAIDKAKTDDPTAAAAWDSATSDLIDIFLGVEGTGVKSRFQNRRLVPVGEAVVKLLRARIAAHRQNGDLADWLHRDLPEALELKLASPVTTRAADFLRIAEDDPPTVKAIYELVDFLIDEITNNPSFHATVTGLADMAQLLVDDDDVVPILNALGRVIEPKRKLIPLALRFLKPAIAKDTKQSLTKVLRNAYKEQAPGKSPIQTLLDLATELHRLKPGSGAAYTGPDFQEAFRQAKDFLGNQETGLEKFFEIVKSRCGGPCPGGQ
jgi:hypothetical protein